jgi:hypothetical protein
MLDTLWPLCIPVIQRLQIVLSHSKHKNIKSSPWSWHNDFSKKQSIYEQTDQQVKQQELFQVRIIEQVEKLTLLQHDTEEIQNAKRKGFNRKYTIYVVYAKSRFTLNKFHIILI